MSIWDYIYKFWDAEVIYPFETGSPTSLLIDFQFPNYAMLNESQVLSKLWSYHFVPSGKEQAPYDVELKLKQYYNWKSTM